MLLTTSRAVPSGSEIRPPVMTSTGVANSVAPPSETRPPGPTRGSATPGSICGVQRPERAHAEPRCRTRCCRRAATPPAPDSYPNPKPGALRGMATVLSIARQFQHACPHLRLPRIGIGQGAGEAHRARALLEQGWRQSPRDRAVTSKSTGPGPSFTRNVVGARQVKGRTVGCSDRPRITAGPRALDVVVTTAGRHEKRVISACRPSWSAPERRISRDPRSHATILDDASGCTVSARFDRTHAAGPDVDGRGGLKLTGCRSRARG